MKNKLVKLINVKTILTFAIVGLFIALSIIGKIESQHTVQITMVLITWYFTTQKDKEEKKDGENIS